MSTLTEQQIKEIAEEFDCGFRAFWHKKTGELIFTADFSDSGYYGMEIYEDEDQEKLEQNFDDYIEIERPDSRYSFSIMENFTDRLSDNSKLKDKLIHSLNKKKPFSQFKHVIDNSGEYRQQWFDFKEAQLKQWVRDKFKAANYDYEDNEEF